MRGDRYVFLAMPTRWCIAHTENGQRRQPRIEIGAEFAVRDAFLDDVLEYALQPTRPTADAPAALGRQMLAFIKEHLDEIGPVDERRQMRFDQRSLEPFMRISGAGGDGFGGLEETLDALQANQLEGRFL